MYNKLEDKEIRLLLLLGDNGTSADAIRCVLQTVSLTDDTNSNYKALSYVWNQETICKKERSDCRTVPRADSYFVELVDIHGESERDAFVTSNLWHALHALRQIGSTRTLFVDALCIDQENAGEKSDQVSKMAQIYSRASKVLIWLGVDVALRRFQFQQIVSVAGSAFNHVRWVNGLPLGLRDMSLWIAKVRMEGFKIDYNEANAFKELLSRSQWFRRVWVLQEAAMARDSLLLCGEHAIPWEDFVQTCEFHWKGMIGDMGFADLQYSFYDDDTKAFIQNLRFVRQIQTIRTQVLHTARNDNSTLPSSLRLDRLLQSVRDNQSTHAHDKIYGVLSMSADAALPLPDYGSAVEKVYETFAVHLAQSLPDGWFDILSFAELQPGVDSLPHLASWIPNWCSPRKSAPLSEYAVFHACTRSPPVVELYINADSATTNAYLAVRGAALFTVVTISLSDEDDTWIDLPYEKHDSYPCSAEAYVVAFARLMAGRRIDLKDPTEDVFHVPCEQDFWSHSASLLPPLSDDVLTYSRHIDCGPPFASHLSRRDKNEANFWRHQNITHWPHSFLGL